MTLGVDRVAAERAVGSAGVDHQRGALDERARVAGLEPDQEHLLGLGFLVRITAAAARSFVERSLSVIGAGRPDCPFCGEPIDPDGHLCVRANGFRRRDPV